MTTLLEKIVSVIAPHRCVICSIENNIVCDDCANSVFGLVDACCTFCGELAESFATCAACKKRHPLEYIWIASDFTGVPARIIKQYKFAGARAAAAPLGHAIAAQLPLLTPETLIVPIPTTPTRIRQRGYDHALLLAKAVGQEIQLPIAPLLSREHDARQVGATRSQRFAQAATAFYASKLPYPRPILLIDDVVTTGATLDAAAKVLISAGATSVNAAVIAKQAASGQQI